MMNGWVVDECDSNGSLGDSQHGDQDGECLCQVCVVCGSYGWDEWLNCVVQVVILVSAIFWQDWFVVWHVVCCVDWDASGNGVLLYGMW